MALSGYKIENKSSAIRFRRGFTLIELMVTIAVAAVLLAIAIPGMNELTLGNRLSAYANNLVASVHLARSEAIKRNAVVTMCVSTDGANCAAGGWEQGWIILSGDDVVQRQHTAAAGFKITESGGIDSLNFQPTGFGATQATFTVCRSTPAVGGRERVVSVSPTGRPSVEKTSAGVCPG